MTWYKCDCGSEVLHIEAEAERIADDKLVVYLNVSIMHVDSRRSLWNKLRHCWHILRTGKNYADLTAFAQADEIILNWENIKKLSEDVSEILNRYEELE